MPKLTALDPDLLITPPGLRAIVEEMSWDGREAFLNGTAQPVFATVATADTPKDFGYTPPGQMVVGEYKVGGNLALMKLYDRGHDLTKDGECFTSSMLDLWAIMLI